MQNAPATQQQSALTAADFMPAFDIAQAIERRNAVTEFVKKIMVDGTDFGKIPGVDKPTLLKPGAEKLVTFFGLSPEFILEASAEDWTGAEHRGEAFFHYRYKCRLTRAGRLIGEGEGSCNSWESKYRYRWMPEAALPAGVDKERLQKRDSSIGEFEFAIDKAETTGKYGKPAEYWNRFKAAIADKTATRGTRKTGTGKELPYIFIPAIAYRMPNPDVADVVNTVQKMSQKRALVAAVLVGVNASEFFTQDVEDMTMIEMPAGATPSTTEPHATQGAADQPEDATVVSETKRAPASTKGKDPKKDATTGAAARDPMHPHDASSREVDAILTFKEAKNMAELTTAFNALAADVRRPGTKIYEAFKARRKELGVED